MNRLMTLLVLIAFVTSVTACGRGPRDLPITKPDDQKMTCQGINMEMTATRDEIGKMLVELQTIDARNTGLVVVSWFTLLATLPFVDVRQGQYADLKALRIRHAYLDKIRVAKKCTFATIPLEKYEQQVLDQNLIKVRETYPKNKP